MQTSLLSRLLVVAAALVCPTNAYYNHISVAEYALRERVKIAHGLAMGVAFGILFPLAAALIRMGKYKAKLWTHAGLQVLALVLAIAGLGLGVWLAVKYKALLDPSGHMIIGIVVVGFLCLMPLLGWMHHVVFVEKGRRSVWSHAHIWIGRIMIVLGGINGGLGFKLNHSIRGHWQTAYIVLAAVCFSLWFVVAAWNETTKFRTIEETSDSRNASDESLPEDSVEQIILNPEKKGWAA